jgi:hypothetical protein
MLTIARWPIGQAPDSDSVQTGSTPVRAANIAPWRNRNAAVCKTVMSRGSTDRGIQIAKTQEKISDFHALVAELD